MDERARLSRREFVRYAASGAAGLYLSGCAAVRRRGDGAAPARQAGGDLVDRETFRRLVDVALNASEADHTLIVLHDRKGGWTEFDLESIGHHACDPLCPLLVRVAFGQQEGAGTVESPTADGVVVALRAAEERAQAAVPNPDYLPPLPPQRYPVLPTYRPETAAAGPKRRAAAAEAAIALGESEGAPVSGTVATYAEAIGVAADTGLFAFEQRTHAGFRLTARGPECVGHAGNIHRSIDDLGIAAHTRAAIRRAKLPAYRAQLAPGRYTVVLGPSAVARLVRLLLAATGTGADGTGPDALRDKLGHPVIDGRLTLQNRPDHPDLLGGSFDLSGLPADAATWIERGALKRVGTDRRSAREHDTVPTYVPDAPHLSAEEADGESLDDLAHATERGVLVTDLARVAYADPNEFTLTGVTGSDTALIDGGSMVAGLGGLRWHAQLLAVLSEIDMCTTALEAVPDEAHKLLVPALVVRDFAFEGPAS
jgi:predicted Zn-dependent protease